GVREVDRDMRAGGLQGGDVVADVDLRDELQVVGRVHRRAHFDAHLAPGAEDADPDALSHRPKVSAESGRLGAWRSSRSPRASSGRSTSWTCNRTTASSRSAADPAREPS